MGTLNEKQIIAIYNGNPTSINAFSLDEICKTVQELLNNNPNANLTKRLLSKFDFTQTAQSQELLEVIKQTPNAGAKKEVLKACKIFAARQGFELFIDENEEEISEAPVVENKEVKEEAKKEAPVETEKANSFEEIGATLVNKAKETGIQFLNSINKTDETEKKGKIDDEEAESLIENSKEEVKEEANNNANDLPTSPDQKEEEQPELDQKDEKNTKTEEQTIDDIFYSIGG